MNTKNQIKLIKVIYIVILLSGLIISTFGDGIEGFKKGMEDANNGVSLSFNLLSFLQGILLIIILFLSLRVFLYLYRFMDAVERGEVFSVENIERLTTMGWYCVMLSFGTFLFNCLELTRFTLSAIMNVGFEFWLLVLGITLLTIAFVFKKGIELKQENDLTI
ncbi:DUF2975 domain-containing protein [Pedobacter changchengzhani]|uniref:DUF2975 domain-containing protein n=1 Tax=Pedobacter changchengzhani TaxID=2529274 RepID=A0A4R5MNA6_9SPHI|nr:DUF2975 domain-containing protein [Pedobacter changchengzhani]TDG36569.1 DUF2975 domain-containing protein [Pedobacter changchengzhani]